MTDYVKKQLRDLSLKGLTLVNYNWSDVEDGLIKNLYFTYTTKEGKRGEISLGDLEVDFYKDCGDICVDILDGLYILEDNGIEDNFSDYVDDNPDIKLKDIPKIESEFDWEDFYWNLMEYYED